MGIGEPRCDCLDLMIVDLSDALVGRRLHLGDALPWRRFLWAMLVLGVSSPWRRLVLTLTPGVDFDLDFVNARIRDGTQAPPVLSRRLVFSAKTKASPTPSTCHPDDVSFPADSTILELLT